MNPSCRSRARSRRAALWLALCAVSVLCLTVGARKAEAADFTWCVKMNVDLADTDIGEDYLLSAQDKLARFMWVRLSRNDGSKVWALTYLDALGCLAFSDTTNGPFKLELRSQARVPRTDNGANTNTLRVYNSAEELAEWTIIRGFPAAGGAATDTLPQSRRTNMLAVGTWSLMRFSDGLTGKTITMHDAQCPSYATPTSCAGGNGGAGADVWIMPGHDEKKFLVAHELGHAVQWLWFNFNQPGSYSINDGGAACEWSNPGNLAIRLHALHTKEHSSIAFTEGFAQYFSTYAFNATSTTAWFHYYKDDYKGGAVTLVDMENGDTGGETAYLDNVCTNDVEGKAGMGVELDWARQLWDFRTNAGNIPTNYQIMRSMKNGFEGGAWSQSNTFARSEVGVQEHDDDHGTSIADRWHDLALANGIDH